MENINKQHTMTDKEICDSAEEAFTLRFRRKFEAGMKKYGTPITDKDCLAEAEVEVLDLWAYLHAEKARRNKALKFAKFLRGHHEVNKTDPDWDVLIELLSPKPLAVPMHDRPITATDIRAALATSIDKFPKGSPEKLDPKFVALAGRANIAVEPKEKFDAKKPAEAGFAEQLSVKLYELTHKINTLEQMLYETHEKMKLMWKNFTPPTSPD